MNILIVSQYFWPENFKINEFCTELIKRGHQVTVITGKPNYPKGKFYDGFGFLSKIKSEYDGVKVYRLPIIPRGKATGLMLSLNYLSFAFLGSIFSLFHNKKYDFSLVFAVSPITAALPAIVHRAVYGTRHFLWVLDLWPEGVEVTGKLKFELIRKSLYHIVRFVYSKSDRIYVSSRYMKNSILEKFDAPEHLKVIYLPQWAEDDFINKKIDKGKYKNLLPEGFKIMFAGNIGSGQDIPAILNAAKLLKNSEVKFIFLGDGSEKGYLLNKIKELDLSDKVYYLGSYPVSEMIHFYYHANMMLLTLRDELIYSFTVPAKLQSYLASSKPVAAMINGEAADIIKRSECGIVVDAGDFKSFKLKILDLITDPSSRLKRMKNNGYRYYENVFKKEKVIDLFLKHINQ